MARQLGRISGGVLEDNLLRQGINLNFKNRSGDTALLHLDVNNQKIGINNEGPTDRLNVPTTVGTVGLVADTYANIDTWTIENNEISLLSGNIILDSLNEIQVSTLDTDDIRISDNTIKTKTPNTNLELRPDGTGTLEIQSNWNITGDLYTPNNITFEGSLILGDDDRDDVAFAAEINSDIIADSDDTYNLGRGDKRWESLYTNLLNGQRVEVDSFEIADTSLALRQGNIFYVSTNGDDVTAKGDHQHSPFRTLKRALEFADASIEGPVTIHIYPGEYEEEFPLTVPDNVSIHGHDIRNTIIKPASGYEFNDAFLLNDSTKIENLTVKDFYSVVNDQGAAFRYADNALFTERSPYIRNVSVITTDGYHERILYPDQSGITWFGNKYENGGYYGLNTKDYWAIGWFRSYGGYPASSYLKWVNKETGEEGSEDLSIGFGGNYGDAGSFTSNSFPAHNTFVIGEDAQVETVTLGFGRRSVPTPTGMSGISGSNLELGQAESLITTNYAALTSAYNTSATVQDTINVYTLDSYVNGQLTYSYSLELGVTKFVISDDYIVVGDNNGDVYDTATGTLQRNLGLPSNAGGIFAIEGTTFVNVESNTITVYDLNTGSVIGTKTGVPTPNNVSGNTLVDGFLIYRSGGSTIYRYDLNNLAKAADEYPFVSSAFQTDGRTLAAAYSNDLKVAAIDSAGSGAVIDGSVIDTLSQQASMLFHSATFITPNADAITMTNGVRIEWLNCFTYFANRGLHATQGTGRTLNDGSTVKYGAEIRSIGSANVYGNYGAVADGADTLMYLIGHNFAYIGAGTVADNDRTLTLSDQETRQLNNGKIYYTSTDADGTFRVGNAFYVDFTTGETSIDSDNINFDGVSAIFINTGGNITYIDGSRVDIGNIRISGNTIETLDGDLLFSPTTGNINLFQNDIIKIPRGDTNQRRDEEGGIRYHTDDNLFEGYTSANVAFGGVFSDDRQTKIVANRTTGEIEFYANGNYVGTTQSTGLSWNGLGDEDILFKNNLVTTTLSNSDLEFRTKTLHKKLDIFDINLTGFQINWEAIADRISDVAVYGSRGDDIDEFLVSINAVSGFQQGDLNRTGDIGGSDALLALGIANGLIDMDTSASASAPHWIEFRRALHELRNTVGLDGSTINRYNEVFYSSIIESATSTLSLVSTDDGYIKFDYTGGLKIPSGTNLERPVTPEIGDTRWNTNDEQLETWNGTDWQRSAGTGPAVTAETMNELLDIYTLVLG